MKHARYYLEPHEIGIVRRACKHMELPWRAEAARPRTARKLVKLIGSLGLAEGCEEWGRLNREGV
jgi:hypothetical protein